MHFDHSLLYLSQLKLLIMYPAELVKPMREDLTSVGFVELTNPDEVNSQVPNSETAVLIVNSVCGCAAANARPGVKSSLINDKNQLNYLLFLLELIKRQLMLREN